MATEILRINLLDVYIRAEIAKLANFRIWSHAFQWIIKTPCDAI